MLLFSFSNLPLNSSLAECSPVLLSRHTFGTHKRSINLPQDTNICSFIKDLIIKLIEEDTINFPVLLTSKSGYTSSSGLFLFTFA